MLHHRQLYKAAWWKLQGVGSGLRLYSKHSMVYAKHATVASRHGLNRECVCSLPKSMSGFSMPSHSVKAPDFRRSIDERYQGRFNDQKQGFPSASPHTIAGSSRCAGNTSCLVRCSAPVEPCTEITAGDGVCWSLPAC